MSSKAASKHKKTNNPNPSGIPADIRRAILEIRRALNEATGTKVPALAQRLLKQVCDSLWVPNDLSEAEENQTISAVVAILRSIRPQDEIEGMLAVQMIATHNAAMECLRRSILPEQTYAGRDLNLRHATKFLSIFAKQMETLNKNRGKGQQKVTVEHVQIQSGGQAIVGSVEHKPK